MNRIVDPSDPRPDRWIVYRRTYVPNLAKYIDLPISGHKTPQDAAASEYVKVAELERMRGNGESPEDGERYWIEEKPPVYYRAHVEKRRIAQRAFARRADVLAVLERLDLPLEGSGFMIAPWPPNRSRPASREEW